MIDAGYRSQARSPAIRSRQWVRSRVRELRELFNVEVYAFAVMSSRLFLVGQVGTLCSG